MSPNRLPALLRHGAAALLAAAALAGLPLGGCGGGGDDTPSYALAIDGPAARDTTQATVLLTGDAFLPPGSTCPGGCSGPLPAPVYGQLGPHTLRWSNAATGESGDIGATWVCNCGGSPPSWMTLVPLAPGANTITVTMSAGGRTEQASVTVRRT